MGRLTRDQTVGHGSTNHCIWRSHDNQRVLEEPEFAEMYLHLMGKYKDRYGVLIHAYCLMGTHPHVMVTATKGLEAFSRFWQVVNGLFARYYNRRKGRVGEVVRERMKSPTISGGEPSYQLQVMVYGDLNPVRAGLHDSPGKHPYSSHRHYAYGEKNDLITDAPDYLGLAYAPADCRKKYLELFNPQWTKMLMEQRRDFVFGIHVGESIEDARKRERADASKKKPPS